MTEGLKLKATAHVKLIKQDEKGNVIDVIERDVDLTDKEAREAWLLRQQDLT